MKLRLTEDLLERHVSSVATASDKEKFPYHSNKIFTCNIGQRDFCETPHKP
jgi:hypothetical protein